MKDSNKSQNNNETTRRDFLKASTIAASAALLGTSSITRNVFASGSDTLRIGMIGCGGRNAGAASEALTADAGAKLISMCDIFIDRIQQKRNLLKERKPDQVMVDDDYCFTGFDGYKHVIESCDVVLIANAAKFHPLHTLTAIQAGKHVFVEKPHGIDPAGVKVMRQACELAKNKGLCIVSGLHSRYHEGIIETVQRIKDGAIGDIISIEENYLRAPYVLYERKAGLSELQWQCSNQYHFRWLSGDDVVQSLVHNLDRASWVMGNKVPIKCHGLAGRSSMTEPIYGDVFDHHSVIYEFEKGIPVYAFCRTIDNCYNACSSIVRGCKGKADITGCIITGENKWRWKGMSQPYQKEHDALFAAIRSGKTINNGEYMINSTMISIMGQISCLTGKEVTWEEVNQSDFYYAPKPEDCRDDMEPPVKPNPDGTYPVVFKPGFSKII